MLCSLYSAKTGPSKVIFLIFLVSLLGLFVVNIYTKKYVEFFENLENIIQKAYKGDYSGRLKVFSDGEISEVSKWLNAMLEKIENSLNSIKRNVNYFINLKSKVDDPLFSIQELVNELAALYKFKNIIEKDKDKSQIYDRIIELLQKKFDLYNFIFY